MLGKSGVVLGAGGKLSSKPGKVNESNAYMPGSGVDDDDGDEDVVSELRLLREKLTRAKSNKQVATYSTYVKF